jgi:iduronate 2-sulfatase
MAWGNSGELTQYSDMNSLVPQWTGKMDGTSINNETTKQLRRGYYACVSFMDFELGRVLNALDDTNYAENTVVVVMGDHGYQLGEHNEWVKHTNFGIVTNTLMMVHIPGLTADGFTSERYAELVDIFPTITEAALGITLDRCPKHSHAISTCTEGKSLVPIAIARKQQHDTENVSSAVAQFARCQGEFGCWNLAAKDSAEAMGFHKKAHGCLSRTCTMGYTLIATLPTGEYRYTEWVAFNTDEYVLAPDFLRGAVGGELYDHSVDPMENVNLYYGSSIPSGVRSTLQVRLHDCVLNGCPDTISWADEITSQPTYLASVCSGLVSAPQPPPPPPPPPTPATCAPLQTCRRGGRFSSDHP